MIPIAKPSLGEEEAIAAREVILSGWVTQGPKVEEFEAKFAEYVGARFACAVSNCTAALHLALMGIGVGPGDVVITVSHSFIATANSIRHCGAEPVFIDIDPILYNMDINRLRDFLEKECELRGKELYFKDVSRLCVGESPLRFVDPAEKRLGRIGAILTVHQMGMPCNIDMIVQLAKQYGLHVIEDAACAIGSEISLDGDLTWEKIGKPHGTVACFSFHPRKVLTTGDGGMLSTNCPVLDAKFRLWRQHGMGVTDLARHSAKTVVFEDYLTTGYNYRMTDIQAAVGIEQLKKLDGLVYKRRKIANHYKELFRGINGICLPYEPASMKTNWQSFPIRLQIPTGNSQKTIMQFMQDNEIACRRGIMNAHQEKPYSYLDWNLPNSESCRDQVILLPIFCDMDSSDIYRIAQTLIRACSV